MRARAALLALLAAVSCSPAEPPPPASIYRHYGDRLRASLPFLGSPCGSLWDEEARTRLPMAQCYVYRRSVRLTGILRIEPYGPAWFFPGESVSPTDASSWQRGWRAVSDRYELYRRPRDYRWQASERAKNYRVTIDGQVTAPYGSRERTRIVLVERIDMIRRVADR